MNKISSPSEALYPKWKNRGEFDARHSEPPFSLLAGRLCFLIAFTREAVEFFGKRAGIYGPERLQRRADAFAHRWMSPHDLPFFFGQTAGPGTATLQSIRLPETIAVVYNTSQPGDAPLAQGNPFCPGTMAVVTLGNPREKFWGAILTLSAEGLSLCGIELASFEDLVTLIKEGEPFSPSVVFFPMHRLERMELDLPDGDIPSLSQRFTTKTGLDPATVLLRHSATHSGEGQK